MSRIVKAAKEFRNSVTATARQMAALSGLIFSCTVALGRNARFRYKMLSMWTTRLVDEYGWNGFSSVTEEVKQECDFWVFNIERLNGQPIRRAATVLKYYAYGYSDAGGFQLGGFMVDKHGSEINQRYKVPLTEDEVKRSSTLRELRSIDEGLRLHSEEIRGRKIRWACDN